MMESAGDDDVLHPVVQYVMVQNSVVIARGLSNSNHRHCIHSHNTMMLVFG